MTMRPLLAAALAAIIPAPCGAQDITLLCVMTNADNHPFAGDTGNVVEVWLNPPKVLWRHVLPSSRAKIDATSIKAWFHDIQKHPDGTENIQDGFEVIDRVTGDWY